jgi:hypothetical protein
MKRAAPEGPGAWGMGDAMELDDAPGPGPAAAAEAAPLPLRGAPAKRGCAAGAGALRPAEVDAYLALSSGLDPERAARLPPRLLAAIAELNGMMDPGRAACIGRECVPIGGGGVHACAEPAWRRAGPHGRRVGPRGAAWGGRMRPHEAAACARARRMRPHALASRRGIACGTLAALSPMPAPAPRSASLSPATPRSRLVGMHSITRKRVDALIAAFARCNRLSEAAAAALAAGRPPPPPGCGGAPESVCAACAVMGALLAPYPEARCGRRVGEGGQRGPRGEAAGTFPSPPPGILPRHVGCPAALATQLQPLCPPPPFPSAQRDRAHCAHAGLAARVGRALGRRCARRERAQAAAGRGEGLGRKVWRGRRARLPPSALPSARSRHRRVPGAACPACAPLPCTRRRAARLTPARARRPASHPAPCAPGVRGVPLRRSARAGALPLPAGVGVTRPLACSSRPGQPPPSVDPACLPAARLLV